MHVFNIVWTHGGLVIASEGIWRFQEHQRFFRWLKFQFAGVVGVVQAEGKQRAVRVWLRWEALARGHFTFVHYRIFQRRETFCENTNAIAWLYFHARLWRAEQNGVAWIQRGKFAQGAQQLRGVTL